MRLLYIVMMALILTGCASNLDAGMAKFNAGNYQAALPHFLACANERIAVCMNNMGASAERLGNSKDAKDWYVLAARYDDPTARGNLRRLGLIIPEADLSGRANNEGEAGVLDYLNAMAGAAMPIMDGYSSGKKQATAASENTCSSDFSCGTGYKCIKAPMKSTGTCMQSVGQNGLRRFDNPDVNSVGPNMNINGQCSFSADCPLGFTCDKRLKACVKSL